MSGSQSGGPASRATGSGQTVRVVVAGLLLIWGVPLIAVGAMLIATGSPIGYALLPVGVVFLAIGITGYVLAYRARKRAATPPAA